MELREIETVLTLAEELHFGRTAERLRVSTAHVSQTVRTLERRLNCQLFERTSRRVKLTPLGGTLVSELRPIIADLDRHLAKTAAMAAGLVGPLRIGHIMTAEGVPQLEKVCAEFERRVPAVTIRRLRFDVTDYAEALRRGDIDIWLTWWPAPAPDSDPDEGLRCGPPIAEQSAALLIDRSHPLGTRASITLDELAEHPVIDVPQRHTTKLFRQQWYPETTPSGRPLSRILDPTWERPFHELARVLERGELGWLTISSFLETVSMPRTLITVPVSDAAPFVLVPWWRADRETPAIIAFTDIVARLPHSP